MDKYRVKPGAKVRLSRIDPNDKGDFKGDKKEGRELVGKLNKELEALDVADNHHEKDHLDQARYMKTKIMPIMNRLRALGDEVETRCATSLWPVPSYRELLFIK